MLQKMAKCNWCNYDIYLENSKRRETLKPIIMNKDRRKQLADAKDSLDEIIASLNDIRDEEQDAYDNMPESLQSSDNGSRMTDAIDAIDEAISSVEEAQQHIDEAAA